MRRKVEDKVPEKPRKKPKVAPVVEEKVEPVKPKRKIKVAPEEVKEEKVEPVKPKRKIKVAPEEEKKEEKKEKDINFVKRTTEILSARDVKNGSSKLDDFVGKYVKMTTVPGIHKILSFHADRSGNALYRIMYNGKIQDALVNGIQEIEM
jgi:outer membrane biosynthesis protein TonB